MIWLLLGCWEDPKPTIVDLPPAAITTPPSPMDTIREAASIANAIEREPDRADQILENNGTTREEYDALLYEIAIDPPRAQAYKKLRSR